MSNDPMVGQLLGRFRIIEQLGAGGMGVVYRAHDDRLDRDVALKVLPPGRFVDEESRKKFRQEAQALAKLNHPNIATIYDFDSNGTTDFLAMELLTGKTIADQIREGPIPENILNRYGIQMAEGLAAAHERGILHRDLKPGNLGLTSDGRLKILDFGLAKLLESGPEDVTQSKTGMGLAKGTLAYMAPEQLRGENIDARVDIYAAGGVLYEMATGKRPHPQEYSPLLINAILNENPRPPSALNPEISPSLEAVILKALERESSQRYQSAADLLIDLGRLGTSLVPIAARQATRRRMRKVAIPTVIILLSIFLFLGYWLASKKLQWRASKIGQQAVLLVGEFENRTNEPVFDNTLHEMFASALEQSHYVAIFPRSRIADVLRRMGRESTQKIDEETGREICQREGLQGLLVGSIAKLGTKYVLMARVETAAGSDILTEEQYASNADELPSKVDAIAESLRRKFGETLQSLKENSVPLATVSSPSLEAVRYFTLGKQRFYNGDPQQAVLMFNKALELDANFAMAHEYLGLAYEQLQDSGRTEQQLYLASQLVDHVSEPERLKILADYNITILDFQKGCEYYQVLAQLQPLDPAPYINLGYCYKETFDYAAAISYTQKALQFVPQSRVRINLASQLFLKGDTQKAWQAAQTFNHEYGNDLFAQNVVGHINLALGKFDIARQSFNRMLTEGGDSEVEGHLSLADLARATGHYREAKSELRAVIAGSVTYANQTSVLKAKLSLSELLLEEDSSGGLSRELLTKIKPPDSPTMGLLLGIAYARSGQMEAANTSLTALNDLIQKRDVPVVQALRYLLTAEIALAERRPADAVIAAQKAIAYQNSAFSVEILGRCYAAAGDNAKAAQQYETLLTRGNERIEGFDEPAFSHVTETHYHLGVLYQKLGQTENSRSHLKAFMGYWATPDTDLKMYMDAQRLLRALPATGTPTAAT